MEKYLGNNMGCQLSIIVISYNTREMTLECLRSIFEETHNVNYEVVLFDNASTDESYEAIEKEFSTTIKLINSPINIGFAAGNNEAIKEASGDYILLLNPDTIVFGGAIDKLYSFACSQVGYGIYGGRTYDGDGVLEPTSCWKKPSLWSLFCVSVGMTSLFNKNIFFDPESYGGWERDTVRNVDIVTGCFLLIHSRIWEQLGGFSTDFFMYAEEADLCLRASAVGVQPVVTPKASIVHYGGASEKVVADKMVRMLGAKVTLIRKHWNHPITIKIGERLYIFGAFIRAWHPLGLFSPTEKTLSWRKIWRRRLEWVKAV